MRFLQACDNCIAEGSLASSPSLRKSSDSLAIEASKRKTQTKGKYTDRRILLCSPGPGHYDPVFPRRSIEESAAMAQSILYELLYSEVFGVPDALEAGKEMLYGFFDPLLGKPEVYKRDFQGSAMEALQDMFIPFPYKVAKALDPGTYR